MSSEVLDAATKTKIVESRLVMAVCDHSGFQFSIVKLSQSNNSISMTQLQQM